MKTRFTSLIGFFFFFFLSINAQPLEVNPPIPGVITAEDILEQVFMSGGIEVVNVQFLGDQIAVGEFKYGMEHVGIEEGIILSTGSSSSGAGNPIGADGFGNQFASTDNNSFSSSSDLEAISAVSVNDVAIFEIDFIPSSDTIRFRYSFGSEEYPEFACSSFNDAMGLFLSGPGINGPFSNSGVNIALIPNTDIPVAINNIHPQNGPGCPPEFEDLYNDNNGTTMQPVYDGYLDVFEALHSVIPGETYKLKIAIGDGGDQIYDSAFFLEAESFESDGLQINTDIEILSTIGESNFTKDIPFSFEDNPSHFFPMTYEIGGTATYGVDYTSTLPQTGTINNADEMLLFDIQTLSDGTVEPYEYIQITFNAQYVEQNIYNIYLLENTECSISGATEVCAYEAITLEATITEFDSIYVFENNTPLEITNVNTAHKSDIEVGGLPYSHLWNLDLIESVCINIDHSWLDDLNFWLIAPDRSYVELATDIGANCDDFTNTCFSPSAEQSIYEFYPTGSVCGPGELAPFEGTFGSEGNWSRMQGAALEGTWTLALIDDAQGFSGVLENWSISFNTKAIYQNDIQWSTGETGSSITVLPETTTEYEVSYNEDACTSSTTVEVLYDVTQLYLFSCENEDYIILNDTLTVANPTTTIAFSNVNGCDSIIAVTVDFAPTYEIFIEETITIGDSLEFGGNYFDQPGMYQHIFSSSDGCDSTVNLTLIVEPGIDLIPIDTIQTVGCTATNYCLPIEPGILAQSTINLNDLLYDGPIEACGDNGSSIVLPPGENQLIVIYEVGIMDTSNVFVAIEPEILPDTTLLIDNTVNFSIDDFSFCGGEIVSIENTCPELSSNPEIGFDIMELEGFSFGVVDIEGVDTFCIKMCDNLGFCIEQMYIVSSMVTSTNEILLDNIIHVYPNPTEDFFKLELMANLKIEEINLFSINGKHLKNWKEPSSNTQFDTNNLNSGLYLIKIKTEKGTLSKRIVINK